MVLGMRLLCTVFLNKGRAQLVLPCSLSLYTGRGRWEAVLEIIFLCHTLPLPQEDASMPGLDAFPPSQQRCLRDSIPWSLTPHLPLT